MRQFFLLFLLCTFWSCKSENTPSKTKEGLMSQGSSTKHETVLDSFDYDISQWEEITVEDGVILDLKYATDHNFTQNQIYPCGRCFLRPELASRIKTLQKDILWRYGMRLKLFDCYRPKPAQQKLWDIVPDEKYVTHPAKGSMHNRGLAVDISLVGANGQELDMGTPYDFFGREAHTDFFDLPSDVIKNRKVLNKMMNIHGLKGIQSEWWHYSLKTEKAPLDDWEWSCK